MIKTYAYSWRLQMNFNALAYSSAKLLTRLTLMFLSYRNQSKDLTTICLLYLAIYWILNVPCISESCTEIKIKLDIYFHTPLWCLRRVYEGI